MDDLLKDLVGVSTVCAMLNARYSNNTLVEQLVALRECKENLDYLREHGISPLGEIR